MYNQIRIKNVSLTLLFLLLSCFVWPTSAHADGATIHWVREIGGMMDGGMNHNLYTAGLMTSRPAFVDIDNDGDQDLFVHKESFGRYILYYENIGTAESPIWAEAQEYIDVQEFRSSITHTFTDINNDGDQDLFFGEADGRIFYYENIGTAESAIWAPGEHYNEIDVGLVSNPAFTDIDADGDQDLFVTELNGEMFYYENTGTAEDAIWAEVQEYNGIVVVARSDPAFADIDNDGDQDLFIGEARDTIYYYENIGTAENPIWAEVQENYNEIDLGWSAPTFTDIDNDGDQDLFVGESEGRIYYYENIGTPFNSIWAPSEQYNEIDVGSSSSPTFTDIDNDGDPDLFIGTIWGGIVFYRFHSISHPLEVTHRIPSQSGYVGEEYSLNVSDYFEGGNGDSLSFNTRYLPRGLHLDEATGVIHGTPHPRSVRRLAYRINITASDGIESVATYFYIRIYSAEPPQLTRPIEDQRVIVGEKYTFWFGEYFTHPQGGVLSYTAEGLPAGWMASSAGAIKGIATEDAVDDSPYAVTVTAHHGEQSTSTQFMLTVAMPEAPADDGPIVTNGIPDMEFRRGAVVSIDLETYFTHTMGLGLEYEASGLPGDLFISDGGVVKGVLATDLDLEDSPFEVTVTATDGVVSVSDTFEIRVVE